MIATKKNKPAGPKTGPLALFELMGEEMEILNHVASLIDEGKFTAARLVAQRRWTTLAALREQLRQRFGYNDLRVLKGGRL